MTVTKFVGLGEPRRDAAGITLGAAGELPDDYAEPDEETAPGPALVWPPNPGKSGRIVGSAKA